MRKLICCLALLVTASGYAQDKKDKDEQAKIWAGDETIQKIIDAGETSKDYMDRLRGLLRQKWTEAQFAESVEGHSRVIVDNALSDFAAKMNGRPASYGEVCMAMPLLEAAFERFLDDHSENLKGLSESELRGRVEKFIQGNLGMSLFYEAMGRCALLSWTQKRATPVEKR